ncbi:MAG: hypothetical protein A3G24_12130 [Betaproteobacteria bacterium RIFCSPLOWO2_12_FULL_62_13]|nr:MAG: hypothetical protein A3G24_12130 [Betaproteobacteria bacterium RIFCSPLOWO2_12_FULL_62_13]
MPPLYAISVFVRIVEAKSLTEAAKRLGISPAAASKNLSRLEEKLRVRLVNRTTRKLSLTDDGAVFFERCRHILAEFEDAETMLTHRQTAPRGRLRVQMPVGFGHSVMVPLLVQFAELYNELTINVEFSNRVVDLAEEGVDVVVWNGERRDSSLVAKRLCDIHYVTVASPKYLERFGEPRTPEDLRHHKCLGYYVPHINRCREWNFVCDGQPLTQEISGGLNMNNGAALLDAAIRGVGIARVAMFLAADAVRTGQLRVVLRDFISPGPTVWAGYLARPHLSPRIRTFVDFLTAAVPAQVSTGLTLASKAKAFTLERLTDKD